MGFPYKPSIMKKIEVSKEIKKGFIKLPSFLHVKFGTRGPSPAKRVAKPSIILGSHQPRKRVHLRSMNSSTDLNTFDGVNEMMKEFHSEPESSFEKATVASDILSTARASIRKSQSMKSVLPPLSELQNMKKVVRKESTLSKLEDGTDQTVMEISDAISLDALSFIPLPTAVHKNSMKDPRLRKILE